MERTIEYCVHCGKPPSEGEHTRCTGVIGALDPPRFCPECARRMVVQVTPSGWSARCSRHGDRTSSNA
ncbi:MAG TPA: hypothetical protein VGD70_35695, partial [Actinophytocola sp.]